MAEVAARNGFAFRTEEQVQKDTLKDKETESKSRVVARLAEIDKSLRNHDEEVRSRPFIKTSRADVLFGCTILLNAAFIGVDLELGGDGFNVLFWLVECGFLVIFFTELGLRLQAEHPNYRDFFNAWGCFDTAVTTIGAIDAWIITPILGSGADNPLASFAVLRVFRLVRLIRLVRILRMFSELVILVQTLGNSMAAVGWMSVLLFMIIYTGSVITVLLLGQPHRDDLEVQRYFGSLGNALFSHFCVVTLENWPDIALAATEKHWIWAFYFVGMIALMNFALVNLMVGVIVERIIHLSMEQVSEMSAFVAESEQFESTLRLLWEKADHHGDKSGETSRQELRDMLARSETHEIFSAFSINLNVPPAVLHRIMDLEPELDRVRGPVVFEHFFDACLRLCGSKQDIHSIFVQHDICDTTKKICNQMDGLEITMKDNGFLPGQSGMSNWERGPGSRRELPATPAAVISHLIERMDKFGQMQQSIVGELQAFRDHAKAQGFSEDALKIAAQVETATPGPGLIEKPGMQLGSAGCIDALFCRRDEGMKPPTSRSASVGPLPGADRGQSVKSAQRKGP